MNAYGARAMDYWRQHRPAALAAMADPETFFTELGEQILAEVLDVEVALAGAPSVGEQWMERVGRLNMARTMAEERVLGELVYSTWEDEEDEDDLGWEPLIPPDLYDDEEA